MPEIYNVGNYNSSNNRKLSSKLTFEVGESFKGKIIGTGDDSDVTIRLTDGWQFNAIVEGELDVTDLRLVNFKVEGFENGRLKLKIVQSQNQDADVEEDIVGDFLQREGIDTEDVSILKSMLEHDIPLTKENISFVKSIITFHDNITENSGEIDKFIDTYLASKQIEPSSEQGKEIRQLLNEFFSSFKDIGQNDIMFFLENNIDLTKENLESYNKLFNSEGTITEYFNDISNELKSMDMKDVNIKDIDLNENEVMDKLQQNKEEVPTNKNETVFQSKQELASKMYESNNISKGKVSMLSLLKTLAGKDIDIVREGLKEILIQNENNFTTREFNENFSKINSMDEKEFIDTLSKSMGEDKEISEKVVKDILKNILGKDVSLSKEGLQKFKEMIETKMQSYKSSVEELDINKNLDDSQGESETNISSSKVPESSSKDTASQTEISNKGIENAKISDNNKGDKVQDGKLKSELIKGESLNNKDIIKSDIKNKLDNIKDVVKDLVKHTELQSKGEGMDKLMSLIKDNINDFKLLNSISNEYYYADIPVQANGQEYPCKLIIKDNRKDGKRIDKTNVKLVVAVKTIHLGTVDGYLKVNNKSLHVDLKCDDKYVKFINGRKKQLLEGLETLGYSVTISVFPKVEEVNLVTCREFFEQKHDRAIDIKV